jgi:hypothetical protein
VPFKTTDEDLKRGDLVRIWSYIIHRYHYEKVSELAIVSRYYRRDVSSRGHWLFHNHKGEFSCTLHRVEIIKSS